MANYPIIALWSHPRSMSTAIERIMRERGDLTCFHEPFLYDYYVHRAVREMPHFEPDENRPADYDRIWDMLLEAGEKGPVFFKDMSYYVVPRIYEDEALAQRLTNAFLIRDPMRAITSYYRVDPELTSEEIGIEAQWRHFTWLERVTGRAPIVLEAEQIQGDPEAVISAFWAKIGLAPAPHAFHWQSEDVPKDWQDVAGWHGSVTSSTGIKPPANQADAEEKFATAAEQAPCLREFLKTHHVFYDRLRQAMLGTDGH